MALGNTRLLSLCHSDGVGSRALWQLASNADYSKVIVAIPVKISFSV
jgi:hypothetical protein